MKPFIKNSLLASVAALALLTSASAGAERIYYLVGVRHVYAIGADRDLHLSTRQSIELKYADAVAADQATFQQHVDGGADKDKESELLNGALEEDAVDRDKELGALFDVRDDLRTKHPEFQEAVDGPYQVIGVDQHRHAGVIIFDHLAVFAPWPGYIVIDDGYYGGWTWGYWYTPAVFGHNYRAWYGRHRGEGFYGFRGSHGAFRFAPGHGYSAGAWHPGVHIPGHHGGPGAGPGHPVPTDIHPPVHGPHPGHEGLPGGHPGGPGGYGHHGGPGAGPTHPGPEGGPGGPGGYGHHGGPAAGPNTHGGAGGQGNHGGGTSSHSTGSHSTGTSKSGTSSHSTGSHSTGSHSTGTSKSGTSSNTASGSKATTSSSSSGSKSGSSSSSGSKSKGKGK